MRKCFFFPFLWEYGTWSRFSPFWCSVCMLQESPAAPQSSVMAALIFDEPVNGEHGIYWGTGLCRTTGRLKKERSTICCKVELKLALSEVKRKLGSAPQAGGEGEAEKKSRESLPSSRFVIPIKKAWHWRNTCGLSNEKSRASLFPPLSASLFGLRCNLFPIQKKKKKGDADQTLTCNKKAAWSFHTQKDEIIFWGMSANEVLTGLMRGAQLLYGKWWEEERKMKG